MKPIFSAPEVVEKGWGNEIVICNTSEYCGKLLNFKAGSEFSNHFHIKKRETFYVLVGELVFKYFDLTNAKHMERVILAGNVIEIPRCVPHQVKAIVDSTIIEVSTTHEDSDSYRIGKGDSQKQDGK